MATITSLSQFLTDVANAIRTKTGGTEEIPAANFDTEIQNIPAINNQDKTATPSTSQQIITPDDDYTGLGSVTISAVDNTIDSNISADNIKTGITILGVTGTLEDVTALLGGEY